MNNAFRDKSKDHKSKHYWFRYFGQGLNNHNLISLSPYPREISQATMMAGSSRWQSAVIGGNGAWRARMRTMNPKSNRTCLYRRSDRGPVLTLSLPGESVSRGFADRGALEGYPSHYTSLMTWNRLRKRQRPGLIFWDGVTARGALGTTFNCTGCRTRGVIWHLSRV